MSRRFTDADLAGYMTRHGMTPEFKFRANPKPKEGPSESQLQQEVMSWWSVRCQDLGIPEFLLYAVPLQAARSAQNGARMKREGARKGTPDMFLLVPSGMYSGMAIEMKKPGGKLSPEQVKFLAALDDRGYKTCVCFSGSDAVVEILRYLKR